MSSQLSLALKIRDDARFDNFVVSTDSVRELVLSYLQQDLPFDAFTYLWGSQGAGNSHLLQAACHRATLNGLSAVYFPLREVRDFDPHSLFNGLESQHLVCLDELDAIAGEASWELALFNLYNRLAEHKNSLICAAQCSPRQLDLGLADLTSRLNQCMVFHLPAYTDEEKMAIVCSRAKVVGLDINSDCAAYLLKRGERELSTLMDYLIQLDAASLQAQRRVTIPFIKSLFNW